MLQHSRSTSGSSAVHVQQRQQQIYPYQPPVQEQLIASSVSPVVLQQPQNGFSGTPPLPGWSNDNQAADGAATTTKPTTYTGCFSSATEAGPVFGCRDQTARIYSTFGPDPLEIELEAQVDRGFFIAEVGWACYRRNYFQVSSAFNLVDFARPPGDQKDLKYEIDVGDDLDHQEGVTATIRRRSVVSFSLGLRAKVSDGDKSVELVQHTAKRDKGPQNTPRPTTVRPGGTLTRSPFGVSRDVATFDRVQFKSATANNGKRRAAQQYFTLVVDLFATTADGDVHPVLSTESQALIVRGRSPGQYSEAAQERANRPSPPRGEYRAATIYPCEPSSSSSSVMPTYAQYSVNPYQPMHDHALLPTNDHHAQWNAHHHNPNDVRFGAMGSHHQVTPMDSMNASSPPLHTSMHLPAIVSLRSPQNKMLRRQQHSPYPTSQAPTHYSYVTQNHRTMLSPSLRNFSPSQQQQQQQHHHVHQLPSHAPQPIQLPSHTLPSHGQPTHLQPTTQLPSHAQPTLTQLLSHARPTAQPWISTNEQELNLPSNNNNAHDPYSMLGDTTTSRYPLDGYTTTFENWTQQQPEGGPLPPSGGGKQLEEQCVVGGGGYPPMPTVISNMNLRLDEMNADIDMLVADEETAASFTNHDDHSLE